TGHEHTNKATYGVPPPRRRPRADEKASAATRKRTADERRLTANCVPADDRATESRVDDNAGIRGSYGQGNRSSTACQGEN
ncbi:MAG: hypothetical protein ACKPJD_32875, partial [Planctomycetaceae bacterium]